MDMWNALPIHYACFYELNVETAKYLYDSFPSGINQPDSRGQYPLHYFVDNTDSSDQLLDLLNFMLEHDKGAVSTQDNDGNLALHIACEKFGRVEVVKLIFDAHPYGMFIQNNHGKTPMDVAIADRMYEFTNRGILAASMDDEVVRFLQTQLICRRQALEDLEPDKNGQLPIHRIMQCGYVSVGTIKLMVTSHEASVTVLDKNGCTPLHYACRFRNLNIVKYLVERSKGSTAIPLNAADSSGNLPLHHACIGGNLDV
eukprot:scaffold384142_cov122-Cyclotella_meneghiniana.AAC.1